MKLGTNVSDISNPFLAFTSHAIMFVIAEIIEWTVLVHDDAGWHFRFGSAEDYPNLRPLISTAKAAMVIFVIALIVSPFILPGLWNKYVLALIDSSKYWILLFPMSVAFSFLWIWHHIAGKDWNWQQGLLGALSALFFAGYLYVNLVP